MNFQAYWKDLRKGLRTFTPNSVDIISTDVLHTWSQDTENPDRPSFVVVSGTDREALYRQVEDDDRMFDEPGKVVDLTKSSASWVYGLTSYLTAQVGGLRIPPEFRDKSTFMLPFQEGLTSWEIIWALTSLSFLVVDEPVDKLIDLGDSLQARVYQGLLEARFLAMGGDLPSVSIAVQALSRWVEGKESMTGEERRFLKRAQLSKEISPDERFEALHFLLTLAKQNKILEGTVIALEGLESLASKETADELYHFLETCDLWGRYGSPLGIVIGWRGLKEDAQELRRLHPRLAKKIIDADQKLRGLSGKSKGRARALDFQKNSSGKSKPFGSF